MLVRIFKIFLIFFILLCFFSLSASASFFLQNPISRRFFRIRLARKMSGWILKVLGIEIQPKTQNLNSNYLIVANHLSYLDVLAICSITPCVFVTSVEVQNSGFLGWVAKSAGSLFVERRNKSSLKAEIEQIATVLKQGFSVVIFPEGTSTCGKDILPFKTALFTSAIASLVNVLPLCLNYSKIDNKPLHKTLRDELFYYGDMQFFPHFLKLLSHQSVELSMELLSEIPVLSDSCRKSLAQQAHQAILERYIRIA